MEKDICPKRKKTHSFHNNNNYCRSVAAAMIKKTDIRNQDKEEHRRRQPSSQNTDKPFPNRKLFMLFINVVSQCSLLPNSGLKGWMVLTCNATLCKIPFHHSRYVHVCMMYAVCCMKRGRRMLLNANSSVIYNALIWHGVICAQSYDVWIWLYHTPFLLHMFIELVHFCDYKSYFDVLSSQCELFEWCLLEYSFVAGGNWESIA